MAGKRKRQSSREKASMSNVKPLVKKDVSELSDFYIK